MLQLTDNHMQSSLLAGNVGADTEYCKRHVCAGVGTSRLCTCLSRGAMHELMYRHPRVALSRTRDTPSLASPQVGGPARGHVCLMSLQAAHLEHGGRILRLLQAGRGVGRAATPQVCISQQATQPVYLRLGSLPELVLGTRFLLQGLQASVLTGAGAEQYCCTDSFCNILLCLAGPHPPPE